MPNTETINWGWLNDATGNKFAPITFYEKIYTENGRTFKDELKNPTFNEDGISNGIVVEGAQKLRGVGGAPRQVGGLGRPIYFLNGEPTSIGEDLKVPKTLIMMGSTSDGAVTPTIHFGLQEEGEGYYPSSGRSVDIQPASIQWNDNKFTFSSGNAIVNFDLNDNNSSIIANNLEINDTLKAHNFKTDNTDTGFNFMTSRIYFGGTPNTEQQACNLYCWVDGSTQKGNLMFQDIATNTTVAGISSRGSIIAQNLRLESFANREKENTDKELLFIDKYGNLNLFDQNSTWVNLPPLSGHLKITMSNSSELVADDGDSNERYTERSIGQLNFINYEAENNPSYGKINCRRVYTEERLDANGETVEKEEYTQISLVAKGYEQDTTDSYFYIRNYIQQGRVSIAGVGGNTIIKGAAWNDYAEYRNQIDDIEPGYCVASMDNGLVYRTNEKLQACDGIVSDTFGFSIGETESCRTPIAVAGRVLAYCEGDRNDYHAGDTVCASANGKICKMTREEIREYPDRIVGVVSEIPQYEVWENGIEVKGRVWVKVK